MQQVREGIKVRGGVELEIIHPDGSKEQFAHENLVVNAGLTLIAARMAGASKAAVSHMAIGAGSAIPQPTDTTLSGTEHDREAGVASYTGNRFQLAATFTAGTDLTVGEIGLFNAAVAGDMLARFIFPVTQIAAGGILNVTWFIFIGGE